MRTIFVLTYSLFCILCSARTQAQKPTTFSVDINHPDSSVHTSVLISSARTKPNHTSTYHWYAAGAIHTTDGGFSGRLLHGSYTSYYPDRNMKAQGKFERGLKQGQWMTWYPTGRVHEIIHFSHGVIDGTYEIYDARGNLLQRIYYRNGLKHGKTTIFSQGKSDSIVTYKRGSVKVKKNRLAGMDSGKSGSRVGKDSLYHQRKRSKSDSIRDSGKRMKKSGDTAFSSKEKFSGTKKRKSLRDVFRMRKRSADIDKQD